MSVNPPVGPQVCEPGRGLIDWLLDSDPSIRWQVMRDLTGATAEEVDKERARVAYEGAGAGLLEQQGSDGRWPLETEYPGIMPVELDEGEGRPSRWNTLRALRVLRRSARGA